MRRILIVSIVFRQIDNLGCGARPWGEIILGIRGIVAATRQTTATTGRTTTSAIIDAGSYRSIIGSLIVGPVAWCIEADELVLRLNNILKRTEKTLAITTQEEIITIGKYTFDSNRCTLTCDNFNKQLTQKEAQLIAFLFNHKNQILKREDILNAVWGNDDFFSGRSMDVFITKLRKKLQQDNSIQILNVRGFGYKLVC